MRVNLLFDLDQTLLNFHASERIALEKVITGNGLKYTDDVYKAFKEYNKSLWLELEKGTITRNELFTLRFNKLFKMCEGDATGLDALTVNSDFIRTMSENGVLLRGADEFLKKVKTTIEGAHVYIISNGATINAKGRIASTGLDKYLDGIFISEDMGVNKPSPEYFDKVFDSIKVPRSSCIVIGDSLSSDMLGAKNAGLDSVWFMPTGDIGSSMKEYDINYCASSYDELYEVLKSWTSGLNS